MTHSVEARLFALEALAANLIAKHHGAAELVDLIEDHRRAAEGPADQANVVRLPGSAALSECHDAVGRLYGLALDLHPAPGADQEAAPAG